MIRAQSFRNKFSHYTFLCSLITFCFFCNTYKLKAQIYYNFAWDKKELKDLLPYRDTITVMCFGKYYNRPYRGDDEEMVFPDTLLLFNKIRALRVNMSTHITRLLPDIYKLKELKEVEMTLYTIGPEIGHWSGLEHLVIFGMRSKFPAEFASLKNLKYLYISNDSVTTVPLEIYELNGLKELQLSMRNVDSIPDGISKLSQLEKLELHRCGLKNLPDDLGKLPNLKELALNVSTEIDWAKEFSKLAQLKSLEKLTIEYPGIKNIPVEIGLLDQVKYLKINTLKEDFDTINMHLKYIAGMEKLEELDLELNFNQIPESIREMKNLRILTLSYIELKDIPYWLNELPNLEKIDFLRNYDFGKQKLVRERLNPRIKVYFEGSEYLEEQTSQKDEQFDFGEYFSSMKTGDTLHLYCGPKLLRSHSRGIDLTIVRAESGYEAIEEVIEGFHFIRTGWVRYPIKEKDLQVLRKLDRIKSYHKDRRIPILTFNLNGRTKKISHKKLKGFGEVYRSIIGKK